MSNFSYRIEGLDIVIREIERRRLDVRRSIRQMLAPGADVVKQAVMRHGKGRFKTHITRTIRINMAKLEAVALVGPIKKETYIARFLEFGTRPHVIRARRGSRGLRIGGRYVRSVQHPGARASPFLQPAFEESKTEAMAAIASAATKILGA